MQPKSTLVLALIQLRNVYTFAVHLLIRVMLSLGLVRSLLLSCWCPPGFGSIRCPAPATIAAVAAVPVVDAGKDIEMTVRGQRPKKIKIKRASKHSLVLRVWGAYARNCCTKGWPKVRVTTYIPLFSGPG